MTLRYSRSPRAVNPAGATLGLFLALTLGTAGCKNGYSSESTSPDGSNPASELLAPRSRWGIAGTTAPDSAR